MKINELRRLEDSKLLRRAVWFVVAGTMLSRISRPGGWLFYADIAFLLLSVGFILKEKAQDPYGSVNHLILNARPGGSENGPPQTECRWSLLLRNKNIFESDLLVRAQYGLLGCTFYVGLLNNNVLTGTCSIPRYFLKPAKVNKCPHFFEAENLTMRTCSFSASLGSRGKITARCQRPWCACQTLARMSSLTFRQMSATAAESRCSSCYPIPTSLVQQSSRESRVSKNITNARSSA